MLKEMQLLE